MDLLLVERGLAESQSKAGALILAGSVFSGETRINKAGETLKLDAPLRVAGKAHPYASRGGLKLEGALEAFSYDPNGVVAADFGSSTGGFTDCLLQRGAKRVFAIDVGYGLLHYKLRTDERVVVMERTNARHLTAASFEDSVSLVVIDASFIGLEKLLPAAKAVLSEEGHVIALVKPQFQVRRESVGKGGVVRDEAVRQDAIESVIKSAELLGFEFLAKVDSKIAGPKGNREALIQLRLPTGAKDSLGPPSEVPTPPNVDSKEEAP